MIKNNTKNIKSIYSKVYQVQLAIPIVLIGVAYLVSNDEESNKEGFSYINEKKNQGNLLSNQNDDYHANVQESSLNMNNEETLLNIKINIF